MGTKHAELLEQVQREKDEITVAVIAYSAEPTLGKIHAVLNDPELNSEGKKASKLKENFQEILQNSDGGTTFSPKRAETLADRYYVRAALDSDGAGHIILEDSHTNTMVIAGRGTENNNNKINDLVVADAGNIAMGDVPIKQFVLHLNDVTRHMTEKGQPAVQFGYRMEQDPTGVYHPRLTKSEQSVVGTGVLYNRQVSLISNHSEGSVYGALESDIFDVQNRSINGPGVSKPQMLDLINDAREVLGKEPIQEMGRYQLQRHTTGVSIIDNLWDGLPGKQETIATKYFSHSSVDAMHVREMAENILINNPKIEDRETLEKFTLSMTRNAEQTQNALKIYSANPSITTFEQASEINQYKYLSEHPTEGINSIAMRDEYAQKYANAMKEVVRENLTIDQRMSDRFIEKQPITLEDGSIGQYIPLDSSGKVIPKNERNPEQNGAVIRNIPNVQVEPESRKPNPARADYDDGHTATKAQQPKNIRTHDAVYHPPKNKDDVDLKDLNGTPQQKMQEYLKLNKGKGTIAEGDVSELNINGTVAPHTAVAQLDGQALSVSVDEASRAVNPNMVATAMDMPGTIKASDSPFPATASLSPNISGMGMTRSDASNYTSSVETEPAPPVAAVAQAEPIRLPHNIASLHEQITNKFGDQLAHLDDKSRDTVIAMATEAAVGKFAQTVDYIHINEQGKVLMGFDNNIGYSNTVNINDAPKFDANTVLTASIDLQQTQQQDLAMRQSMSQNQSGPTMTMTM